MGNPYGRLVILPLTNQSGGSVAAGDVVYLDTAHDDAFITGTTANYTGGVGVAQATIGAGAVGLVLVSGYAALVNVNASVTRGHFGSTFTVAKQATDAGASRAAGTFCQFLTGGATPNAMIWQPDLGGAGMTNPMTTTGDLITSSSGATPDRIAAVATGSFLGSKGTSTEPGWLLPPGHEFDYAEKTTRTTVTATTEATADTVVSGNAVTYDGSTVVVIECYSEWFAADNSVAGRDITVVLYDGSSSIGQLALARDQVVAQYPVTQLRAARRLTPSAASHTYSIRAFVVAGTGYVEGGAGGSGNPMPAFIRITKV